MERHSWSEPPILADQKSFNLHALNPKVVADVRYPRSVLRLLFLRYYDGLLDLGLGNHEWIGKGPTLKQLFSVKIRPEVRNRIDFGNEGKLFGRRDFKEVRIMYLQNTDHFIIESALKLQPGLLHR